MSQITTSNSTNATGGLIWTRETGNIIALKAGHGYINTNIGLTVYTLPIHAKIGTIIALIGESAGLWKIAQNAGQKIFYGDMVTSIGVAGTMWATKKNDVIYIVCTVADTTWTTISAIGTQNVI